MNRPALRPSQFPSKDTPKREPYQPKYIYTIYDPKAPEGQDVVETINADLMDHSEFPKIVFRDDKGVYIGLHHLSPGHSIGVTDRDGYSLQETH